MHGWCGEGKGGCPVSVCPSGVQGEEQEPGLQLGWVHLQGFGQGPGNCLYLNKGLIVT